MILALDSSAVIDVMRGRRPEVRLRLMDARRSGQIMRLCTVALGELIDGAHRAEDFDAGMAEIRAFLGFIGPARFDSDDARVFGRIKADLFRRGQRLEAPDLLIAAQALRRDWTVVTSDVGHFGRVPGLPIIDWRVSDQPLTREQIAERLV